MLSPVARGMQVRHLAVHVHLTDHRFTQMHGKFCRMLTDILLAGQGESQESGDAVFIVDPLQEALACIGGLIGHDVEMELVEGHLAPGNLAIANLFDTTGRRLVLAQAQLDKLAKIGLLVAHFNIPRREVSDHAGDTRECRRGQNVVGEDIEQFVFRVGAPRTVLVSRAKARALDERAGIELDLVGLECSFAHKAYVIEFILLGRGAQKICHRVGMDLKAKDAQ